MANVEGREIIVDSKGTKETVGARISRRNFIKAGALVAATAMGTVAIKLLQEQAERNTHYITKFRPGLSPDEGGYAEVHCFNNPDLLPRPDEGQFELVRHGDGDPGTITVYLSVDPLENCVIPGHPVGTKYAVFKAYDANPDTPGVAVSQKEFDKSQARENAGVRLPPRLIEFARWLLGLDNSSSK